MQGAMFCENGETDLIRHSPFMLNHKGLSQQGGACALAGKECEMGHLCFFLWPERTFLGPTLCDGLLGYIVLPARLGRALGETVGENGWGKRFLLRRGVLNRKEHLR